MKYPYKTFVTGGSGSLGLSLEKIMPDALYLNSRLYDLTSQNAVKDLFSGRDFKIPKRIIHLSAKAGGIVDNIQKPMDYYYDNVMINSLLVHEALRAGAQHFTGILSTCAYPDVASSYPMTEDMLHEGPPAATNFGYGYAKRAMAVHIDAVNKQYGKKYNYLIPCNLYGGKVPHDLDRAHFLDTLLIKIKYAKKRNIGMINLMGTGRALRQYMLVDDFARIIKMVADQNITESFNVCPDENLSIADMVNIALEVCHAKDLHVNWDTTKPDGQINKQASNEKMKQFIPGFKFTSLEEGIRQVYEKLE